MRYRTAILALLFVAGLGCKEVFAGPALLFDVNTNKVGIFGIIGDDGARQFGQIACCCDLRGRG